MVDGGWFRMMVVGRQCRMMDGAFGWKVVEGRAGG